MKKFFKWIRSWFISKKSTESYTITTATHPETGYVCTTDASNESAETGVSCEERRYKRWGREESEIMAYISYLQFEKILDVSDLVLDVCPALFRRSVDSVRAKKSDCMSIYLKKGRIEAANNKLLDACIRILNTKDTIVGRYNLFNIFKADMVRMQEGLKTELSSKEYMAFKQSMLHNGVFCFLQSPEFIRYAEKIKSDFKLAFDRGLTGTDIDL